MTPFASSSSMREGTLNEANVLCNISSFLKENSKFEILEIKEYGLLCLKDVFYAAFSPDGIAVAFHDDFDDVVSLVEIKSKCTTATVQKEMALATRYGVFKSINSSLNPLEFKQSVPESSHRCQLIHGMACGDLRHAFYVVASLSRTIRIVHVLIDDKTVECYHRSLRDFARAEMDWVLDGEVPSLDGIKLTHAVDAYTIGKALDLWRAINNVVKNRGRPLPPGRMLLPTIIAAWNRNKGPIDVFSRFMKNCHARHSQLPPLANIWLRLLMSRVYNAYQSFILSRSVSFLLSDECTGYSRFQTHRNLHGSFAKFCSALAKDLTLEMTGDSCSEDGEFENDQEHGALNASGLSIHYNKREMYFTNREMIAKRMNKTLPHVLCKAESKPTSCVWCCRIKHDQSDPKKHTRHGRTTKYGCPVCMVSLCRVKRFNGMSCHERFHSSKSLVDYCRSEMDAMVYVVPH